VKTRSIARNNRQKLRESHDTLHGTFGVKRTNTLLYYDGEITRRKHGRTIRSAFAIFYNEWISNSGGNSYIQDHLPSNVARYLWKQI